MSEAVFLHAEIVFCLFCHICWKIVDGLANWKWKKLQEHAKTKYTILYVSYEIRVPIGCTGTTAIFPQQFDWSISQEFI